MSLAIERAALAAELTQGKWSVEIKKDRKGRPREYRLRDGNGRFMAKVYRANYPVSTWQVFVDSNIDLATYPRVVMFVSDMFDKLVINAEPDTN